MQTFFFFFNSFNGIHLLKPSSFVKSKNREPGNKLPLMLFHVFLQTAKREAVLAAIVLHRQRCVRKHVLARTQYLSVDILKRTEVQAPASYLTSRIKLQVFKWETVFLHLLIYLSQNDGKIEPEPCIPVFMYIGTAVNSTLPVFLLLTLRRPGSTSHRWSLRTFPVCRLLQDSAAFYVSTYKRLWMHLLSANPWEERGEKENMSNIIILIPKYGRC